MIQPKGFLIDLEGTVYFKGEMLEGSVEFIKYLQEKNISHRFLTNATSRTIEEVREAMKKMGVEVGLETILNPIIMADYYLKYNNIKSFYFVGERKIADQFKFSVLNDIDPEVVVLGDMESSCSYQELNKVYNYLINGARLVTTSYSDFYFFKSGRKIDTGAFTKLFENLSNKEAEIVGKPSRLSYEIALMSMGLKEEEIVAVGDDIHTDIRGAKDRGIYSVLVKTGKYNLEDLENSPIKPDSIIERLGDLKGKG